MNGAAVRAIREARGLSQTELAKRIKKDRAYLAHIEAGRRQPSPETTEDIARELRLDDKTAILSIPEAS